MTDRALPSADTPQHERPGVDRAALQAPEDDATRATRLLRAALMLIMGDQDQGGGGKGARLIKPTPSRPPSAGALQLPTMAPSGPRF